MSSEQQRQPASQPRPKRQARGAEPAGATERGQALGYDPDNPATWPGAQPGGMEGQPGPGPAGPGSAELTDPKAMRALAHPVRMSLLELFGYHQTLTATQASELLDESPANCAFHLRTLAKYGFIEEAGRGPGRERPWTLANRSMRINSSQENPQANLAADELSRVLINRWTERARQVYGAPNRVPGWDQASGWSLMHVFMTPDEAEAMREEINELIHRRYEAREADLSLRPPGARPVEWSVFAAPIAAWAPGDPGAGPAPGPESPEARE
jgi:hypothetical protein